MQPRFLKNGTFALIALLAPLPAAAFGDLDCITIEFCGNAGCGVDATPFAVTFDWANNTAILTVDGTDHALPWVSTDETGDALASVMEYGDMDDINHLLRIEARGTDITAYYTFRNPLVTTWRAVCDLRTAA
jgi:hypothetical protein